MAQHSAPGSDQDNKLNAMARCAWAHRPVKIRGQCAHTRPMGAHERTGRRTRRLSAYAAGMRTRAHRRLHS